MKLHWKVALWMAAGVVLGVLMQQFLPSAAHAGATWRSTAQGLELASVSPGGPTDKARLKPGLVITGVIRARHTPEEVTRPVATPGDLEAILAEAGNGEMLWLVVPEGDPRPLPLGLDPGSPLGRALGPFAFAADIFMSLLKMLIVPLVMVSIICGVAGIGSPRELGRLGGKTVVYYVSTSLLAILVGQVLVNAVSPGEDAELGLSPLVQELGDDRPQLIEVFKRMVPPNIVESMSDNRNMLSMIFFALLFGFFITQSREPHRSNVYGLARSLLEVIMRLAEGVLKLIPYGVFVLIVKVVGGTGMGVFKPLLIYMGTVTAALLIHSCITLPILLRVVGGISPRRWFRAMTPALVTAFSTSSSNLTLPVTMETVEKRGRVSGKIASFTLPLGATINMDGTALYECIGVIFLAQYYASVDPEFTLTLGDQGLVVLMALLASVGAAGIPSAGLVMMLTILGVLNLPLEGATLLLAIDRPLDMLRTGVNVWSDTCGAAIVARSEGEVGPLEAGEAEAPPPDPAPG